MSCAVHLCRKAGEEEQQRDVTPHQWRFLYPPTPWRAPLWSCRGWCHPGIAVQLLFQLSTALQFLNQAFLLGAEVLLPEYLRCVLKGLWKQSCIGWKLDESWIGWCLCSWSLYFQTQVHFSNMCFAAYNSSSYNFSARLVEWSSLTLLTGVGSFSLFGGIFASQFTLLSSSG